MDTLLQEIEGMEVVLVRSYEPRGVLIVFHGCMRRPTDWWHYEPTCITCIGQPRTHITFTCNERLITHKVLVSGRSLTPELLSWHAERS